MDLLFSSLFSWGRDHGYHWFNFGMAPLAGLEARAEAAVWPRVGTFIYQHAEHFYNFEGLRRYKAKFGPTWTSALPCLARGLALAPVLLDVTALIAGALAASSPSAAHVPDEASLPVPSCCRSPRFSAAAMPMRRGG